MEDLFHLVPGRPDEMDWATVPRSIFSFVAVSPQARLLWMHLWAELQAHRPVGQQTMAATLGVTVRTIQYWTQELENHQLIVVHRQRRAVSHYELWLPGQMESSIQEAQDIAGQALEAKDIAPDVVVLDRDLALSSKSEITKLGQSELLAEMVLRLDNKMRSGHAYDLKRDLRPIWKEAVKTASENGLNPRTIQTQLLGRYWQLVNDEEPPYNLLHKLVGKFGLLALEGVDSALSHAPQDWFPYAMKVCDNLSKEHRGREG